MAGFVPVNYGVPSIDNTAMANWTPQQVDLYAKLPYYLERATAEQRRWFATLKPLITGRISWKENMGTTMRRVMVEDSPILRQWATPNVISQLPKTDVVGVRERTVEASLRWQNFQTPTFNFRSSFEDFMRGNIEPHRKALTKGMEVFEEMFYLTHLIAYAPYVWVAGHGLVKAPTGALSISNAGAFTNTTGKTAAWWAGDVLSKVSSHLTFQELFKIASSIETEIGMTPYAGSELPSGTSKALDEKYCLWGNNTTFTQFVDDPWLKEQRPINMNIVTQGFRGDIFGTYTYKIGKWPWKFLVDRDYTPTLPAPETYVSASEDPDYNRTKPNRLYGVDARIVVTLLFGGNNYSIINIGAPPDLFTQGAPAFGQMNWNGKIVLNKNILVPSLDPQENIVMDTNSWGHWLRLQAECSYGIVGDNPFNVLPIVHFCRQGELQTAIAPTMGTIPISQVQAV